MFKRIPRAHVDDAVETVPPEILQRQRAGNVLGDTEFVTFTFNTWLGPRPPASLLAAHLSERNNRPELAREALAEALGTLGCLPLASRNLTLGQPRLLLVSLAIFALAIAAMPNVIFCSFGDMLRVPGSSKDLFSIRAAGGQAHGFGSDARKEEEVAALVETIERAEHVHWQARGGGRHRPIPRQPRVPPGSVRSHRRLAPAPTRRF